MSDRFEKGIAVDPEGIWHHGSNLHSPYFRQGAPLPNGGVWPRPFLTSPQSSVVKTNCWTEIVNREKEISSTTGGIYQIDENVVIGRELYPHPRTTMAPNLEFLTARPLRVRLLGSVPAPSPEKIAASEKSIAELLNERGGS